MKKKCFQVRIDPKYNQMFQAIADKQKRTRQATLEILIEEAYNREVNNK